MAEVNKLGLIRSIPEQVKRDVRQRCGFGCVICGSAIYQYEHFDPVFAEASAHLAEGIVLLCAFCHERKTKGLMAAATVAAANANPRCKKQGFSFGPFDLGAGAFPEIVVGTLKGRNVRTLIRVYGDEILSIRPPDAPESPFLLNAFLCDSSGQEVLKIVDNEWQTHADNWDVEVVGSRISIRRGLGDIVLTLRAEPPDRLVVERLNMSHKGVGIACQESQDLRITTPSGTTLSSTGMDIEGCQIGVDVDAGGLKVGVGGGSVYIQSATFGSGLPGNFRHAAPVFRPPVTSFGRVGRNERCPCGSGIKYKKCHGSLS